MFDKLSNAFSNVAKSLGEKELKEKEQANKVRSSSNKPKKKMCRIDLSEIQSQVGEGTTHRKIKKKEIETKKSKSAAETVSLMMSVTYRQAGDASLLLESDSCSSKYSRALCNARPTSFTCPSLTCTRLPQ